MDKLAMMQKMSGKKKESGMSDTEMSAKKSILSGIKEMAEKAMGGKVHGLKKVTVASDSPEGLKEGLELAKEKISEEPKKESEAEEVAEEMEESSEGEVREDESKGIVENMMSQMESCSPDDLEKIVQKAREIIAKKKISEV